MDPAAVKAWLGGSYGERGVVLAENLQRILVKGFEDGGWTERDMMDETSDANEQVELWVAIAQDCATKQKQEMGKADGVRMTRWIEAVCGSNEDKSWTNYVPSQAEAKDLAAQGMTSGKDLRRLELSLFLFRASNDEGIKGGNGYRGIPNAMAEAKLAIKQRHDTIDVVLDKCRAEGDISLLERHFTLLTADLADSDNLMDQRQSARVSRWWSEAKRNLPGRPLAVLTYVEEYRAHYRGRGLPADYDATLGQRAWHQSDAGYAALALGQKFTPSTPSVSSFTSGFSSLPGSASEAGSGIYQEQMKEMMEAVRGLNSTVSGLTSQVDKLKLGANPDVNMVCGRCKKVGHRSSNCPDKKPKEEDGK